jgi:hypothetical protein
LIVARHEAAQTSLDDAVPLLTSDPNTTAKSFIEQAPAERAKLEQLTDNELLRRTAREAAIAGILIFRTLQQQLNALFPTKIEELAVLIRSLTRSLEAVTAGFKQAEIMQDQSGSGRPQADKRRQ